MLPSQITYIGHATMLIEIDRLPAADRSAAAEPGRPSAPPGAAPGGRLDQEPRRDPDLAPPPRPLRSAVVAPPRAAHPPARAAGRGATPPAAGLHRSRGAGPRRHGLHRHPAGDGDRRAPLRLPPADGADDHGARLPDRRATANLFPRRYRSLPGDGRLQRRSRHRPDAGVGLGADPRAGTPEPGARRRSPRNSSARAWPCRSTGAPSPRSASAHTAPPSSPIRRTTSSHTPHASRPMSRSRSSSPVIASGSRPQPNSIFHRSSTKTPRNAVKGRLNAETRRTNERRGVGPRLREWTVIAGLVFRYADPRFDIADFVLPSLATILHLSSGAAGRLRRYVLLRSLGIKGSRGFRSRIPPAPIENLLPKP